LALLTACKTACANTNCVHRIILVRTYSPLLHLSWEAKCLLSIQEIPRPLWNPYFIMCSLFWTSLIHSTSPRPLNLTSTLALSFHYYCLRLWGSLFRSIFTTKIMYECLFFACILYIPPIMCSLI
jgi:hypothetical protein